MIITKTKPFTKSINNQKIIIEFIGNGFKKGFFRITERFYFYGK